MAKAWIRRTGCKQPLRLRCFSMSLTHALHTEAQKSPQQDMGVSYDKGSLFLGSPHNENNSIWGLCQRVMT